MFPAADVGCLVLSLAMVLAYHGYLRRQLKREPGTSVHAMNARARVRWVETVMASGRMDVLAVQTLRNSVMASSFMASTAILLMVGALTLSGAGNMGELWHALNIGATGSRLATLKLVLLLSDFFSAFFFFAMAVRFFNHVGYLINIPADGERDALTPAGVAAYLNRAGRCYTSGTLAFFFCVPLVLWFFGPQFMLAATGAVLAGLYFFDRVPEADRP
jgi:uncharacterized membrane protein